MALLRSWEDFSCLPDTVSLSLWMIMSCSVDIVIALPDRGKEGGRGEGMRRERALALGGGGGST